MTHTLSFEKTVECNGCLKGAFPVKPERALFFQHLQEWDFDRVVKVHLPPKKEMDI